MGEKSRDHPKCVKPCVTADTPPLVLSIVFLMFAHQTSYDRQYKMIGSKKK